MSNLPIPTKEALALVGFLLFANLAFLLKICHNHSTTSYGKTLNFSSKTKAFQLIGSV